MQYTPLSPSIPSPLGEGGKEPLETFHRMQYGVLLFILCGLFGHDGCYFGGSIGRYKFNVTLGSRYFPNSTVWGVSSSDFFVLLKGDTETGHRDNSLSSFVSWALCEWLKNNKNRA